MISGVTWFQKQHRIGKSQFYQVKGPFSFQKRCLISHFVILVSVRVLIWKKKNFSEYCVRLIVAYYSNTLFCALRDIEIL